jgi:hypothetical protein
MQSPISYKQDSLAKSESAFSYGYGGKKQGTYTRGGHRHAQTAGNQEITTGVRRKL